MKKILCIGLLLALSKCIYASDHEVINLFPGLNMDDSPKKNSDERRWER